MKRSLALAVVALAAALPFGAAHAHGNVAIRVDTPEFGIRIGTPFPVYPPPVVVAPAPVYAPPPVIYAPPPVIYAPPRVIYAPPPRVVVPAPVYYGPPALLPPGHYRKHYKVKHHDGHGWGRHWYDD